MSSVISTVMSRLNSFLDSELEQLLCFQNDVDVKSFCEKKTAMFLIMPEEDPNKFFLVSLVVQQLYCELLAIADENGGRLNRKVMMYLDEFGTLPTMEDLSTTSLF